MSEALMGLEAQEQTFVDRTLIDLAGTESKSRLGANAMLAASMAVARAAADDSGLSLYRYFGGSGPMQMPVPMMNVINGGAHANNTLDMQEFMILPIGASPEATAALSCRRSEEHTSELQSLMRISYAVFCLNKKKKHKSRPNTNHN